MVLLILRKNMASRGRGRGVFQAMRKPGADANATPPPLKQQADPLNELTTRIAGLSVNSKDSDLQVIADLCKDYSSTPDKLDKVAKMIYQRCMGDVDLIGSGIVLYKKLMPLQAEGTRFRDKILQLVQSDFKDREKIQQISQDTFVCFVTLLCQIFKEIDLNGEPMKFLIPPICQCLEMLIDGSPEELECLSMQMQSVGKLLNPEQLETVILAVRKKIIESSSARCRCLLLELLELHMNRWARLEPTVSRFYSDLQMDFMANGSES